MKLRDYQRETVDAIFGCLRTHGGNPVAVLPTGAGKSLVIAELARQAVERWQGRVIVLAHRKELLEQNADKLQKLLPWHHIGIYSAGLGRREIESDIVCAGIQSIYKKACDVGARHLVLVDEAHLVPHSGEGMYQKFLTDLREINPRCRLVGLTATPYRTGSGELCRPDGIFSRVACEVGIPRLIRDGYLSPITSTPAAGSVDTSGLHIRGGEYIAGEVEQLFGKEATTQAACQEIVVKCGGRWSVLIFAAGVDHASDVAARITNLTGERCGVVTGETMALERWNILCDFRNGRLRWLVNVDVLTTGFDAPCVDAIAVLRATCSPGLFAQICGRGFRIAKGKFDCLILDFGENIKRHGPLDDPEYGKTAERRGDQQSAGEAPVKQCPNCQAENLLSARECSCGWQFPDPGPRHGAQAEQEAAILAAQQAPIEWLVEACSARLWTSKSGSRTLRVDYECQQEGGGNLTREVISEWVCLEHDGFAGEKARKWWRERCSESVATIAEAERLWNAGAVATPQRITTRRDGRWWRVVKYALDPIPEPEEWRHRLEKDPVDMWYQSRVAGQSTESEFGDDWQTPSEEIPF